jgi:RHS repeat-associated protein
LGNRISVNHNGGVTQYLHDPIGLVDVAAEYDGGGALAARYIHGLGLAARVDAGGQAAYYAFDATGNTRQLSNASGTVVNAYDYDPFGIALQTIETIPNPFRYVGMLGIVQDESGASFMRARYYSSEIGRFLTADPINLLGGYNLYASVDNNPVNQVDPQGLKPFSGYNYCGSGNNGWDKEPTNDLDWLCRAHDIRYECAKADGPIDALRRTDLFLAELDLALGARTLQLQGKNFGGMASKVGTTFLFLGAYKTRLRLTDLTQPAVSWDQIKCFLRPFIPLPPTPPTGPGGGRYNPQVILPGDPNEKTGLAGFGEQHIITASSELRYTVYFENVITATAPAQEVFVTDYLDPNLDWSTFKLGDSAFGDQTIAATADPGLSYSRVTIPDYRPGINKNWWVDVTAQLNSQTGRVDWVFRTLDPETGDLPEDAETGFLPPNDATGRGEGHVSFSIMPKPGVAMGTRITNTASIIFDTNPAIQTNKVWNTLGTIGPECTTVAGADFNVPATKIMVGRSVTFTATVISGTLPITYTWNFGDGQQAVVTTPQVQHSFPRRNTLRIYTVLLSAANACGSQPVQKSVTVWPWYVYLPMVRR